MSEVSLRLNLTRTPVGTLIVAADLDDFTRCTRGSCESFLRIIDDAWRQLDARRADREAAAAIATLTMPGRVTGAEYWRRLGYGERGIRSPSTHRTIPCPDGSWQSPSGHVYWPDSPQVPSAARNRYPGTTDLCASATPPADAHAGDASCTPMRGASPGRLTG